MPVILEEVQPSWVEDGWGIQGEQNEVRFDDDIPWDITAWTRDRQAEDADQTCCAPAGCPTSIEFTGITFCCACVPGAPGTRIQFYELPFDPDFGLAINDLVLPLTPTSSVITGCPFCDFENYFLAAKINSGTSICPDESSEDTSDLYIVYVKLISGTWYVAVLGHDLQTIFFYGTSADPSLITNEIEDCTLSPATWDNPLIECIFGATRDFCSVAFGGTATLTM